MAGVIGLVVGMTAIVGASNPEASAQVYTAMFDALDVTRQEHDNGFVNYGGALLLTPMDAAPETASVMFFCDSKDAVDNAHGAAMEAGAEFGVTSFDTNAPDAYYSRAFTDPDGTIVYLTAHLQ
jgi:hypothetical protein